MTRLDSLPGGLARSVESFVGEMKALLGPRLRSALLYGSVARQEWQAGRSDVNLLLVLDRVDGPTLRQASRPCRRWWQKTGLAAVLLSWQELVSSSDVFPLEYLEMKRHHQVLHGEDPLAGIEVAPTHLRLQVEQELRGKLLRLRQVYLRAASRPAACAALLADSWPSVATLLRGALLARGVEPEPSRPALIRQLEETMGLPSEPLARVEALRAGARPRGRQEMERLFDDYLAALESALAALDTAPRSKPE